MPNGAHRDHTQVIHNGLQAYEAANGILPGIALAKTRETLVLQIISSMRRIDYLKVIQEKKISSARHDPTSMLFDPIRAAILSRNDGNYDQAVWLTFLQAHFGKSKVDGWKLASNVYGSFHAGPVWTYKEYIDDPVAFFDMLHANRHSLEDSAKSGSYSNHRRYQPKTPEGIAKVFTSFASLLEEYGGFRGMIVGVHANRGQAAEDAFDGLYKIVKRVHGFGRLGCFDFLTMMGKLELAPITPGTTYLPGATGPLKGANLLVYGDREHGVATKALVQRVDALDDFLGCGKQVIEDSLCNWQKHPEKYIYFRG